MFLEDRVTGMAVPGLDFHTLLAFRALKVEPLARPCPWFWHLHTQMSSDLGLTTRLKFAQLQIPSVPTGLHAISLSSVPHRRLWLTRLSHFIFSFVLVFSFVLAFSFVETLFPIPLHVQNF